MQRLEVSGAVRPIYGSLGVKRLMVHTKRAFRYTASNPLFSTDFSSDIHKFISYSPYSPCSVLSFSDIFIPIFSNCLYTYNVKSFNLVYSTLTTVPPIFSSDIHKFISCSPCSPCSVLSFPDIFIPTFSNFLYTYNVKSFNLVYSTLTTVSQIFSSDIHKFISCSPCSPCSVLSFPDNHSFNFYSYILSFFYIHIM